MERWKLEYYVMHEILQHLKNYEFWEAYKKALQIGDFAVEAVKKAIPKGVVILIDPLKITERLSLGGYDVIAAEWQWWGRNLVRIVYEGQYAETLAEARKIAKRLSRKYNNAPIVVLP